MKLNQLDYQKFLSSLPKESVDFICIDPPYGKVNGMILTGQSEEINWDITIDWKVMFKELNRVLKPGGTIAAFGQNPTYSEMLLSNKHQYKYEYVWVKNNCAQGFHATKMPLIYTENIAIFIKDQAERVFNNIQINQEQKEIDKKKYPLRNYSYKLQEYIIKTNNFKSRKNIYEALPRRKEKLDRRLEFFFFFTGTLFNAPAQEPYELLTKTFDLTKWKDYKPFSEISYQNRTFNVGDFKNIKGASDTIKNVLHYRKDAPNYHPTQKPVKLLEQLIKTYSNKGDVVLDCFMGSGSTGVAAVKLEREFWGNDISEKYFKIAKERIEQSYFSQMVLEW